ncbi:MAG: hypothetical protein IPN19_05300 [Elusimicrobia bacterium]|nr:hypothetical protein [Elusimicrobiota bacterium]
MSLKLYDGVSTVSLGFCLLLGYKSGLRGVKSPVFASGFDGIKYAKESVFHVAWPPPPGCPFVGQPLRRARQSYAGT